VVLHWWWTRVGGREVCGGLGLLMLGNGWRIGLDWLELMLVMTRRAVGRGDVRQIRRCRLRRRGVIEACVR
jgi:hypothetical protein